MVRMKITQDHGKYRKGTRVLMGWLDAMLAGLQGWAEPLPRTAELKEYR